MFLLWILSVIVGVALLYKVLSGIFPVPVARLTTLLILFGTNFFGQTVFEGPTADSFLFTLLLLMIRLTGAWLNGMKMAPLALMLPVMIAVSFLSEPGIFILLFPVIAWILDEGFVVQYTGLAGIRTLLSGEKGKQLLFLVAVFAGCVILRQFPWFSGRGDAYYFGDTAKAHFPLVPSFINCVLFSVKNGWMVYTPLMIFAFAGFYFLAETDRAAFLAAFLFLAVSLLYAGSNPVWVFNGRFGYPYLLETLAVMSLPLGALVHRLYSRRTAARLMLIAGSAAIVSLNLFQTWQFSRALIVPGKMTWPYYCAVFGKTTATHADRMLADPGKPGSCNTIPVDSRIACTTLKTYNFETGMGKYDPYRSARAARTGKYGLVLGNGLSFSPGLTAPFRKLTTRDSSWLRISGYMYFTCLNPANKVFLVCTCVHEGLAYKYRFINCSDPRFHPRRWNYVTMSYLVPEPNGPEDYLQVYFMNFGRHECWVDDMEISLCKPAP